MIFDKARSWQRIHVEIPVYIGQEKLVSRDVSREGIYFLSDHLFAEGGDLYFSLGFILLCLESQSSLVAREKLFA